MTDRTTLPPSRPPQRIQRKRTRGWRMPEGAVYVGRPSKWGNLDQPCHADALIEWVSRGIPDVSCNSCRTWAAH